MNLAAKGIFAHKSVKLEMFKNRVEPENKWDEGVVGQFFSDGISDIDHLVAKPAEILSIKVLSEGDCWIGKDEVEKISDIVTILNDTLAKLKHNFRIQQEDYINYQLQCGEQRYELTDATELNELFRSDEKSRTMSLVMKEFPELDGVVHNDKQMSSVANLLNLPTAPVLCVDRKMLSEELQQIIDTQGEKMDSAATLLDKVKYQDDKLRDVDRAVSNVLALSKLLYDTPLKRPLQKLLKA